MKASQVWRASAALLAALLFAPVEGTAATRSRDPADFELEQFPAFRRGLLAYRRHHLHHRHPHRHFHHIALAHAAPAGLNMASADVPREGPALEWAPEEDAETRAAREAQAAPLDDDIPDANAMALPGRHPSVEKVLDDMGSERRVLKDKQSEEKKLRGELEGSVTEAKRHMNDGVGIKQQMAKKEAQLRVEKEKLQAFEGDASRLEKTRENLVESLHSIMDPKLAYARARLDKKSQVKNKELEAANVWKEKKEQLHGSALKFLKAKQASHASLLEAEATLAEAQKKADMAEKQYEYDRQMVGREVQSFRYAETRYKAEIAHEQSAEASEAAAKESVDKLTGILASEEQKVDASMSVKREHLRSRMDRIEKLREKSGHELEELEHQFKSWQEQQRSRANEVVQKSQATDVASQAFADKEKEVLDTAQQKVVRAAEARGDWAWDAWPGKGEKSDDFKLGD